MVFRKINTVDEVIDALDGTSAVAVLTKCKPQHVSNWRAEKRLAARTYRILQAQLKKRQISAPSQLWGIDEPERKKRNRRSSAAL